MLPGSRDATDDGLAHDYAEIFSDGVKSWDVIQYP